MFAFKVFELEPILDITGVTHYDHKAQVWMADPTGTRNFEPAFFGTLGSTTCANTARVPTGYPTGADSTYERDYNYD